MSSTKCDENGEEDLYYFESDHLALKGNQDYSSVLKTLFILKAQRERAIKDYSTVVELKKKALENPLEVIEKLQNGIDLGVPPLPSLPEIPHINFAKYNVSIPEDSIKQIYSNHQEFKEEKIDKTDNKYSHLNSTHNKPWTIEEQKKLEALLRVYPPEAIEAKRFEKIAAALGTRTAKQVTSRIQKYFLKLRQSGLPIPGRIPKNDKYTRKATHRHQRHNHYLSKPTTFFPQLCTPVTMNDLDEPPVPVSNVADEFSSNYLMPSQYQDETVPSSSVGSAVSQKSDDAQMNLIMRIRQEKLREYNIDSPNQYVHIGYRCNYCKEEPVVGSRWHCSDCVTESVDFCTDCLLAQLYSETAHPVTHRFTLFHSETEAVSSFSDDDSNSNTQSSKENLCKEKESSDSENDSDQPSSVNNEVKDQPVRTYEPKYLHNNAISKNSYSKEQRVKLDNNHTSNDFFSDTQIVSYNYLHSTMLLEEDNL